ncbi:acyltransferase family protein [Desulfotomaculum sp. 1211_IL3151]|uniref:acyltransferase family protein n=1 Tax=Desulfotomaculum sp. 1211_IL3151 TaxID=3084055 RepID=UPI002FDA361C
MFGILRFFLAIFVAISHMTLIQGFNIGVSSVVIFYLLSGYVMTHSFKVNFEGELRNIGCFYRDRLLRVYPLYFFYAIMTIIFVVLTGYGKPEFNLISLINNFTIVLLNYCMWLDGSTIYVLQEPKWWLIPPAWSLGAELQFYLLIPFILRYQKSMCILILASLLVFVMATLGIIDTDYFGYRVLAGTLFIFLSGSLLYGANQMIGGNDEKFLKIIWVFALLWLCVLAFYEQIEVPFTLEVLVGYILGVLVVAVLSRVQVSSPIENLLGALSYPIFLCHFLAFWIIAYLSAKYQVTLGQRGLFIVQLFLTVLMGYIGYRLIDIPVQRIRKSLQRNSTFGDSLQKNIKG